MITKEEVRGILYSNNDLFGDTVETKCMGCGGQLSENEVSCSNCGSDEVEDIIEVDCPHCNDIATIFFRGGSCTSCGKWIEIDS